MSWARNINTEVRNLEAVPYPVQTAWDYVEFAGNPTPGVAKVSATLSSDLDRQKPKGYKKTYTVDNGDPPVDFDIQIELQPDELAYFRDHIMPVLRPRSKTGGREPLTFSHPLAEFHGVDNIIVEEISTPHPNSGGTMTIRISAFEWTPAPPKKKKTNGATKPQDTSSDPPTAEEELAQQSIEGGQSVWQGISLLPPEAPA